MAGPRRFDTVALGTVKRGAWVIPVRIVEVRGASPPSAYAAFGGAIGEPHASAADARTYAESATPGIVWRTDLTPMPDESPCPICALPVTSDARYPGRLCAICILEAVDARGRAVTFSNVDATGGFRATLDDGTVASDGHVCFVRGVRCRADEAHFGGIVVQVSEPRTR